MILILTVMGIPNDIFRYAPKFIIKFKHRYAQVYNVPAVDFISNKYVAIGGHKEDFMTILMALEHLILPKFVS